MGLYVDPQPLIGDWLKTTIAGWSGPPVRVWYDADPPDDLAMRLPLVHLTGIGGGATPPAILTPTMDVDVYGATIEQARAVTAVVFDALMLDLPAQSIGPVAVARVAVFTYPGPQPYDNNDDVRRINMAFGLTLTA